MTNTYIFIYFFSLIGYDAYAKEEEDNKVSVAVKSKFFSTETCKQTAARIYDALRKSGDWNWLVFDSEVEDLDEGTCIVSQVSQGFEPGNYFTEFIVYFIDLVYKNNYGFNI